MNIGIDGRSLFYGGGTQNYIYNLILHLSEIETNNKYFLYIVENKNKKLYDLLVRRGIIIRELNYPKVIWEQFVIPKYIKKDKLDIYHSTKSNVPIFTKKIINVSTFHGLDFKEKLKEFNFLQNLKNKQLFNFIYWEIYTKISAKKADYIITISNHAKQIICDKYNVPENKIEVVYQSAAEIYKQIDKGKVREFIQKKRIKPPYLLCVSKYSPKKNIETVLKSFSCAVKKNNIQLLFAGKWNKSYRKKIESLIDELRIRDKIRFLGFLPISDLPLYYNGALALFYPSHYEGFGIPIIEAFKCGTPVLTSNKGAIPEIAGDAAIIHDSNDFQSFAKSIDKLLKNKNYRKTLKDKSLGRGETFSWEMAAKKIVKIYKELYVKKDIQ